MVMTILLVPNQQKKRAVGLLFAKKKGQDRNPARFKIQYPMKNRDECKMRLPIELEKISKRSI